MGRVDRGRVIGFVSWGRVVSLVGRGRVSGLICGLVVVLGFTLVFHVSNIAGIVIGLVVHDLSAAVRKKNTVRSSYVTLVIAAFLVSVVVVG